MHHHEETPEEKYIRMTQTPINKLVASLSIPTILSMLITSIYNMADAFFVSKISTSAAGAVGVAFALMSIIQAIGFMFGAGSGNSVSRLLGRRDREAASLMAATGFFAALGVGVILAVVGIIFLDPLVWLLGATPTIAPYAREYIRIILIGSPYLVASLVLNNLLRFQGNAFYAMLGITTGGVLNIILSPIFIFVLDMGIGGAALATILSQLVSFCILLLQCWRGGNIRIHPKNFRWDIIMLRDIIRIGSPTFARQALASFAATLLNFWAGSFSDAAVAAISIVNRLFQFAVSAVIGFAQGFQPIVAFNYGAKHFDRVLSAFRYCIKTALYVLVCASVLGFIFAPQIMMFFRKEDLEVVRIGALALRLQFLTLPLAAWFFMQTLLLQGLGQSLRAGVLSAAKHGLFFLPCVLILPPLFGLLGVQLSQPVADICSFLLGIALSSHTLKALSRAPASPAPNPPLDEKTE